MYFRRVPTASDNVEQSPVACTYRAAVYGNRSQHERSLKHLELSSLT